MDANLVLGWMALLCLYDVVVPDLAAQTKEYANHSYEILT
jgi:hypothetical protein